MVSPHRLEARARRPSGRNRAERDAAEAALRRIDGELARLQLRRVDAAGADSVGDASSVLAARQRLHARVDRLRPRLDLVAALVANENGGARELLPFHHTDDVDVAADDNPFCPWEVDISIVEDPHLLRAIRLTENGGAPPPPPPPVELPAWGPFDGDPSGDSWGDC